MTALFIILSLDQDTSRFSVRQGLNSKFLIQPLEILPVELTTTYKNSF